MDDSLRTRYNHAKKKAEELEGQGRDIYAQSAQCRQEARELAKQVILSEGWLGDVTWIWVPTKPKDISASDPRYFYLDGGHLYTNDKESKLIRERLFFWVETYHESIELGIGVELRIDDNDVSITFDTPKAATAFMKVHKLKLDLSQVQKVRDEWAKGLAEIDEILAYGKSLST